MQIVQANICGTFKVTMELTFWELAGVGAVLIIIILASNLTIYCMNKKLVARLALNSERELAQIRNQVSSLQKTVNMQQSALLRIKQQRK